VSDWSFFPATVGLFNSLRLTGHGDPLVILDCGFSLAQRRILEDHSTLISFDRTRATNPTLFKPIAPSAQRSGVVVVVDSDVIVTAHLGPIIEKAAGGRIVAVPDPESDRRFEEWQGLFELSSIPRRQPYVNAGLVAFSVDHWPDLLPRWSAACRKIWSHRTIHEHAPDGPTSQADQDALNALLMTEFPREALMLLPAVAAPLGHAGRKARVLHLPSLSCTYGGRRTLLVQSTGRPKPWGRHAWAGVGHGAYVRLLRRCLSGPGVALRPPARKLAPWLRSGAWGTIRLTALRMVSSQYSRAARVPRVRALMRSLQHVARRLRGADRPTEGLPEGD
jgi:hypothetical protein